MSEEKEKYCPLHETYEERITKVEDNQDDIRKPDGILSNISKQIGELSQTTKQLIVWASIVVGLFTVLNIGGYKYTSVIAEELSATNQRQRDIRSKVDSMGDVKDDIKCMRQEIKNLEVLIRELHNSRRLTQAKNER